MTKKNPENPKILRKKYAKKKQKNSLYQPTMPFGKTQFCFQSLRARSFYESVRATLCDICDPTSDDECPDDGCPDRPTPSFSTLFAGGNVDLNSGAGRPII